MVEARVFKVIFRERERFMEIYAKRVTQGELFGFVEVDELLFGQKSELVVDPSEESLRAEFKGVRRVFVPLHAIVRIDEVDKEGSGRITKATGDATVTPFPGPLPPGKRS